MPLPKPSLDNRRYDQLVGEGRALIPRLAPQWTDHNASDPGITLIELGAWLAEQNIYRFDRISDEALRAFVRLVGVEPAPAGVARTVVEIANPNAAGLALPQRMQLARGNEAQFETTQPLYASSARLVCVMTGPATLGLPLLDVTSTNDALGGYDAFGAKPRPGRALYLGFDRALDAAGASLRLHVWTTHWQADSATQAALQAEQEALASAAPAACPPPDWRVHYRVRTAWEFYAGAAAGWKPLSDVADETRALSLSGFVRFGAPVGHQPGGPGPLFFIRCRILSGRFECTPRLAHVGFNAVACEHALSIEEAAIGTTRGHALASFALERTPVVAGSVRLRLDDGAGDVQTDWSEAPDFDRAGPWDHLYTLDAPRGLLQCGNGQRAAAFPAGYELRAAYRVGGGAAGNFDAQSLGGVPASPYNTALVPALAGLASPLKVVQNFAASGGTAKETLAGAQARAYDRVSAVDKAVTLADIERLALATPGVPVARVRAVPNLDAALPCYPAAGVVSVIVIPPCPHRAPLPSRALLRAVERYLEPRRLVTSEIHAIAPHYKRVAVQATLHLACDAVQQEVLAAALARLDGYFDPLSGGPDGNGWPFGRSAYRTEVMALLADVDGVDRVTGLGLQSGGCGCEGEDAGARCDNVELCAHELVLPGRHRLTLESDTARNLRRSDAHECHPV